MTGGVGVVFLGVAVALAAVAGFGLAIGASALMRRRRLRQTVATSAAAQGLGLSRGASCAPGGARAAPAVALLQAMELRSRALSMGARHPLVPARLLPAAASLEKAISHAGLAGAVTVAGFWDCSLLAALAGAVAGGLAGAAFSVELALIGLVAGGFAGFRLPRAVLARAVQKRADDLERSLSEMLEVVALGLRSGLSFEGALALYTAHFECPLATGMAAAQAQWSCGLVSREEALRALAASYRSLLFGRVVETIVRSIRFGSSLADNLDDAAAEARAHYRTARQESVAKAPVKMMLPTSTLILPAMLILVLGPVLLELMG